MRAAIRSLVIAASLVVALSADARRDGTATALLFTYFTGNGEDGLHLATSEDGLRWTALGGGRWYLTPTVGTKLMRTPASSRVPTGSSIWSGRRGGGIRASASRTRRIW